MRRCNTWLAVMACWLAMAPAGKGQSVFNRRLYDRSKDEAAQKAAENGKKISSGSIFESELKNVETFAKLEIDSIFSGQARTLRNNVAVIASANWSVIESAVINSLEGRIKSEDVEATIKTIEADVSALEQKLKDLKGQNPATGPKAPANATETIANIVDNGIDVDNAAAVLLKLGGKKSNPEFAKTVELIGKSLAEGKTAADAVAANQKNVSDVAKQLAQLRTAIDGLAAQRLELEIDHLKKRRAIWQRMLADVKRSQRQINGFRAQLARVPNKNQAAVDTIREAVQKNDKNTLDAALNAAFLATSLAARWDSPRNLAVLRDAHEQHRYGILRNRLEAHAYEVAIGSGTQRLALFYKGGIRPEVLAQILQTAATASITGAIAATK